MQLLRDPTVHPHARHPLHLPRPRPEREAVQRVLRALALGGRCGDEECSERGSGDPGLHVRKDGAGGGGVYKSVCRAAPATARCATTERCSSVRWTRRRRRVQAIPTGLLREKLNTHIVELEIIEITAVLDDETWQSGVTDRQALLKHSTKRLIVD